MDPLPFPEGPGAGYEDWYLVEDWVSVGRLNEAAVEGSRRDPHDCVARLSRNGAGGLYRLVHGSVYAESAEPAAWLFKPPSLDYDSFRGAVAGLTSVSAVWQREMVLGPAPEFCVEGAAAADLEWHVAASSRRRLATAN